MDPSRLNLAIHSFREHALSNNWLPLLREARRLMQPIGTYKDDESLLISALAAAYVRRQPANEALRELHGVNCHAENVWRDYYHAYRPHIDMRVNDLLQRLQMHVSMSPALSSPAEGRNVSTYGGLDTVSMIQAPATTNSPATSHIASGIDSLPTPISPCLSLATPDQEFTHAQEDSHRKEPEEDKAYMIRRLQEALNKDESFNVTELAKSMAIEAPHRQMMYWKRLMYRNPDARAILSRRKGCLLSRPEAEDSGEYSIFGTDDNEVGPTRATRRTRLPSGRRKSGRSSLHDFEQPSESEADSDEPTSSPQRHSNKPYINSGSYTDSESRGRHNGPYTLGDIRALASLLLKYPELDTLGDHRLGEFIEENLGIRTASAWRKAFARRKSHVRALAAQMKEERSSPTQRCLHTAPQSSTQSPPTTSSNLPPTKRPRATTTLP
ncbi:unnamed protein product [Peniophora sp. CBMAI 1063]|nr:unnamed protein product [Peniophora sp. CBMAI 1063]